MKKTLLFALIAIILLNYSDATPATLCRYSFCGVVSFCHKIYILKIRDGPQEYTTVNRCNDKRNFCISGNANDSGEILLRYNGAAQRVRPNQWRHTDADAWCKGQGGGIGEAFWLDL